MESAFLSGQMLIAMPGIGDPRFERSLILVCAHDGAHAMGIAVNRPVEGLTIPDLLERLEIAVTGELDDDLVLIGGPVEIERGFVLHTDDYHAEHSQGVDGGLGRTRVNAGRLVERDSGHVNGPLLPAGTCRTIRVGR